jgi:hypothetical protein
MLASVCSIYFHEYFWREWFGFCLETLIGKQKTRRIRQSNGHDEKRADFAWRLKASPGWPLWARVVWLWLPGCSEFNSLSLLAAATATSCADMKAFYEGRTHARTHWRIQHWPAWVSNRDDAQPCFVLQLWSSFACFASSRTEGTGWHFGEWVVYLVVVGRCFKELARD